MAILMRQDVHCVNVVTFHACTPSSGALKLLRDSEAQSYFALVQLTLVIEALHVALLMPDSHRI